MPTKFERSVQALTKYPKSLYCLLLTHIIFHGLKPIRHSSIVEGNRRFADFQHLRCSKSAIPNFPICSSNVMFVTEPPAVYPIGLDRMNLEQKCD